MANMFNEDGTYNKTEWKAGDKITAAKLNKIELSLEAINNNDIDRHVEADNRLDILEERMANTPDNEQMNALEDVVKDNKDAADLALYNINRKIESLESVNAGSRLYALEGVKANSRLDALEGVNADDRLYALEDVNAGSRLDALEDVNAGSVLSVMDFGAVGDGVTDDTQAIKECINHAIENSKSVYIPKGVYIISPNILDFKLKNNQSFILTGDGPVSILKRKDQTVTKDWNTLFRLTADDTNTSDVALIKLENIKIDSNARNQLEPDPENLFQFEHSADFYINGRSNSRINTVHLEGVYATDGVADHIYIAGSTDAYVTNFIVNNFQCDYRTRTRSDLCVTGYINTAMFTNIKCIVLEYELNNSEGLGDSYIFIDNIEAERIDLAGIGLYIKSSNMVVKKNINIANLTGSIMNSMMSFNDTRLVRNPDLTFINCVFMNKGISDETSIPLLIQYPNTISFKNCMFKMDGELESYMGDMVATAPEKDLNIHVEFDGCSFDPRVMTALRFDRSGTARVSNCIFENYYPIHINSSPTAKQSITLSNIIMAGTGFSLYFTGGGTKSLKIHNMICNENNFGITTKNSASLDIDYIQVDRKIYTTVPVTVDWLKNTINGGRKFMTTLKGDKFINFNSPINEPECWTVTTTSQSFNLDSNGSKLFIASGSSYGTTAERPTCYMHKGYQYFDTDLQKHVTWLGSAWSE